MNYAPTLAIGLGTVGSLTLRAFKGNSIQIPSLASAFNNGTTIPGGDWTSYNRRGVVTELAPNAFTEMGVNISQILNGVLPQSCDITIMAKSRAW